ncbi:MAG: Uma2 family endonuclease [Blastocatellia bacterium]
MIATGTNYLALIEKMPPGAVTILPDVDWEEYEELLRDLDERPGVRLTYDRGRLQIMTLSLTHERIGDLFPHFIMALALECGLNFLGARSTTFRKQADEKGAEPDDCYYFNNFKQIAGKKEIDLSVDPPPDLAFEVDISNPSLNKFPIYASIGVPELWRHTGSEMYFYRLEEDEYLEISHSDLFPFLTPDDAFSFLSIGEAEGAVVMMNEFREWVSAHRSQEEKAN